VKNRAEGKIVKLPVFDSSTGRLFAVQHGEQHLFDFKRVFFIEGNSGSKRGQHAHRESTQWLSLLKGDIKVKLMDGESHKLISSLKFGELLIVEAGIWVEIDFLEESVVAVGTNTLYKEADYLRDWSDYLEFRGIQ
jgi:dTDP-4-dehydrorhamnose 3,5-epimerase-like enzyme